MSDVPNSETPTIAVSADFAEAHGLLGLALAPELDGRTQGDDHDPELSAGDTVGRYTLVTQIGKGGFGIVWKASQNDVIKRDVALKIIRAGMNSRSVIARFNRERQALALMSHPFISTVLDAGTTSNHRPYFAMELLAGVPITKYARDHDLDLRQCLELIHDVCMAVQHAHQKGVLHRDLKPSNILVSTQNKRPTPKVIDFGIAKVLHAESQVAESLSFTARGIMLGTPAYMAPEHATLGSEQVDVRADVYSLGAILYEMLTRCQPFDLGDYTQLPPNELFRRICEDDPVRPSTRIMKGSSFRDASPQHAAMLSGEIDWLLLHALEKSPDQRYPSVSALAEDIQRYLQNEPLTVGPPSSWYRFRKLAARNRMGFALGATIAISMTAVAVLSTLSLNRERRAREVAEQTQKRAEQSELTALRETQNSRRLVKFLSDLLENAGKQVDEGKNPEALRLALDESARQIDALQPQPELRAALCESLAKVYISMGDSDRALPILLEQQKMSAALFGPEDPRTQRINFHIARATIDVNGDHAHAISLLEHASQVLEVSGLSGGKDWFELKRFLASELSFVGEHKQALEIATQLSTRRNGHNLPATEDPGFLRSLAEIQRRAGAFDAAQKTLLSGLELLPPNVSSRVKQNSRSKLLQSLSRVEAQRGNLKLSIQHLDGAMDMERLARSDSSERLIDLLIEKSRLVAQVGDTDQAVGATNTALAIANKIGDCVQQMHALRAGADILAQAGRKEEALRLQRECAELGRLHASTPNVWWDDSTSLALLLSDLKRYDEAVELALAISKDVQEHSDVMGKDPTKAERIYEGLIKVVTRAQSTTGRHEHDAKLAEWQQKLQALKQPVS